MQKLGAYLLQHNVEADDERASEAQVLVGLLEKWLVKKHADDPKAPSGEFRSEKRDATGTFHWQKIILTGRTWRMLRLNEDYADGRRFETTISITDSGAEIAVFVTLASGLANSVIAPVVAEVKCPRVVRWILDTHKEWCHGTTLFRRPNRVEGKVAGRALAREIVAQDRTLPIIVISEYDGEPTYPDLDVGMGKEVAGLANVSVVDDEASWALTEGLGKEASCYWGAVRLYWPRFSEHRHPLWTAPRLLDSLHQWPDAAERFQIQVRREIMRVAALSVVRPPGIDQIRDDANRAHMQRRRVSEVELNEYVGYCEAQNGELRAQIRQLEDELERIRTQLYHKGPGEVFPSFNGDVVIVPSTAKDRAAPSKGEVRFYKKRDTDNRKHDDMAQYQDCGHSAWQNGHKGDKAKKGIRRLEGRGDWKSIQHCGTCKGGGVWKVIW